MKIKHTSGPWQMQESDSKENGLLIKPIPGQVVAICERLPEMAANARLLAASPKMLTALIEAQEIISKFSKMATDKEYKSFAIEQAINEATGEENAEYKSRDINSNEIITAWRIEDIIELARETNRLGQLDTDGINEIAARLRHKFDASVGMSWDDIDNAINAHLQEKTITKEKVPEEDEGISIKL